jgi:hypothetical protein
MYTPYSRQIPHDTGLYAELEGVVGPEKEQPLRVELTHEAAFDSFDATSKGQPLRQRLNIPPKKKIPPR